jgi:hypothetical protein
MSWPSCPLCSVLVDLSRLICQTDLSRLTSPGSPVPFFTAVVMSQMSCPDCSVLAAQPRLSRPSCPMPAALSLLSYSGLSFLFCLYPPDHHLWLSCSNRVPIVLTLRSCTHCFAPHALS